MNAITMTEVKSSQIHSIGHDPASNTLAICFRNKSGRGPTYHYENVTAEQFEAFNGAESLGKHFIAHIKNEAERHPFTRITEPA